MTDEAYRHLPYDIEIETALLGACLREKKYVDMASSLIEPQAFYDPFHARLFETMLHLAATSSVTPLTVHAAMKADPGMIETGGLNYLSGLFQAAPAMPHIRDYANVLVDLAAKRALIKIGEDIVSDAHESPIDKTSTSIISEQTDKMLRLGEARANGPRRLASVVLDSVTTAEQNLQNKMPVKFITTGSKIMDDAMGGIQPGDRIGMAARSQMGKSLMAGSMANAAAATGAPVFIASGDMRAKQWGDRSVCDVDFMLNPHLPPIEYFKFRSGRLTAEEIGRLAMAQREMDLWNIEIDDNPTVALPALRGRVRSMARRFPNQQGLLIVDFLQKVEAPKGDRRRDEDITMVSYALGDIVRDLGWSLLALIQMKNKDTDARGNLKETLPTVADVRESGGIEYSLDILFGPYRKAFFHERKEPSKHDPAAWDPWNADMNVYRHQLQTLGYKLRDGSVSALNLDLWCNPGSASVRDERPAGFGRSQAANQADKAAAELFDNR